MNAIAIFGGNLIAGSVKFHQCNSQTQCLVTIQLSGFAEDKLRGIHIHNWGDTRQGCESACAHFNPTGKLHGSQILHGNDRHVGDLVNNIQSQNGQVYLQYYDTLIDLFAPIQQNIIGRMVVIHQDPDNLGFDRDMDQESATTGKAGQRIDCAPIVLYKGD
jgi:Cu-Zn family superoxide dismutase